MREKKKQRNAIFDRPWQCSSWASLFAFSVMTSDDLGFSSYTSSYDIYDWLWKFSLNYEMFEEWYEFVKLPPAISHD